MCDHTPLDIAECVQSGVLDNPEAFAGSNIFARFNTATIVAAEWVGEAHD